MTEIAVRQENNGSTVAAKVGDSLLVELPENPTTAFRWTPAELDASVVALQTDEFILGTNSAVGGGGVRVFRFLATGSGSARLRLKLARAWTSDVPSKLFEIQINVQ